MEVEGKFSLMKTYSKSELWVTSAGPQYPETSVPCVTIGTQYWYS
jgi:hypothetical protein